MLYYLWKIHFSFKLTRIKNFTHSLTGIYRSNSDLKSGEYIISLTVLSHLTKNVYLNLNCWKNIFVFWDLLMHASLSSSSLCGWGCLWKYNSVTSKWSLKSQAYISRPSLCVWGSKQALHHQSYFCRLICLFIFLCEWSM